MGSRLDVTEPTTVKDDLNGALCTLVDDLRSNRPGLETFETWCFEHPEDIQIGALADEMGGDPRGNPSFANEVRKKTWS
jgi:hypothetical protein